MSESQQSQKSKRPITDAIQVVLDEGKKVRERIAKIVTDQMDGQEFSVANLGKTARSAMEAAFRSAKTKVETAVPRDQDGALRDVVYGIGDAFGAAAKAAGSAFESARTHGKEFASEDVKKVTVELRELGSALVDSVTGAARSAADHSADLVKATTEHANQAAQQIKPEVEGALSAAAQHPVELTKDAAKAGLGVTREVAGSLFAVLGEMMTKAADALRTEKDGEAEKPAGDGKADGSTSSKPAS